MNNSSLYERATERNQEVAVQNLAQSLNLPVEGVHHLYAVVFRHFTRVARIKVFISPLVSKRVRELLNEKISLPEIDGRRNRSGEL